MTAPIEKVIVPVPAVPSLNTTSVSVVENVVLLSTESVTDFDFVPARVAEASKPGPEMLATTGQCVVDWTEQKLDPPAVSESPAYEPKVVTTGHM